MEFINGQTLKSIDKNILDIDDKIKIIQQIMNAIKYLHGNQFVYRDLKIDNIIIDHNKTAFLVDFDSMIKYTEINTENYTNDFTSWTAPEVNVGNNYSYECDIYSIGKIIHYLLSEDNADDKRISSFDVCGKILQIIKKCTDKNPKNRPSISQLIDEFETVSTMEEEFMCAYACYKGVKAVNIYAAIYFFSRASDKGHYLAQCYFGDIYSKGEYIAKDINQAIYYYTLAAEQNIMNAQLCLGLIYYNEVDYENISKATYYFTLAANQNDEVSQAYLGQIYSNKENVNYDIKKAIHYFTLASEKNNSISQLMLGVIYYKGIDENFNINKAIEYFSLAAKQGDESAQTNLGIIYYENKYIQRDIQRAIYYFSLASNQNEPTSQSFLGIIYYEGVYIQQDIKKAIHYLTLASTQNIPSANHYLGIIFYEGKYVQQDINKAIHYLTLAANRNQCQSQHILGTIYYEGKFAKRDIDKTLYYLRLAANQNDQNSINDLAFIYFRGDFIQKDIKRSLYLFNLSAQSGNRISQLFLGDFYLEGRYVDKSIQNAIYYYKEVSHLYPRAKNNLGVIYLKGYSGIKKDVKLAKEYFTEAIEQSKDELAMYNLSLVLLNECESFSRELNEPFKLLIELSLKEFMQPLFILFLTLTNKFGRYDFSIFLTEIQKILKIPENWLFQKYRDFKPIINELLENKEIEMYYKFCLKRFYVYIRENYFSFDDLYQISNEEIKNDDASLNINDDFYEGFGRDLIL